MSDTALIDFETILSQVDMEELLGKETPADELAAMKLRARNGRTIGYARLIHALRAGEMAGYGTFIVGRRGYPTRFRWTGPPRSLPSAAAEPEEQVAEADIPEDYRTHTLELRPDEHVTLHLPSDLTWREAERLAHFVRALPLDWQGEDVE